MSNSERRTDEGELATLLLKTDEAIKNANLVSERLEKDKSDVYREEIAQHMHTYDYVTRIIDSLIEQGESPKAYDLIDAYNRAAKATEMMTITKPKQ